MDQKTVLIVTYYWPPAGGPGVQRWLKFALYLPESGIEPVIYTPENPSYPMIDNSLSEEPVKDLKVIKTPIWEPYRLAEFFNPKSKEYKAGRFEKNEKQSFLTRLSVYIRGNFFIPDARKFWVRPSVRFLSRYLRENRTDVLITTGPPHSMHLIGLGLKKKIPNLKWIADFRDPWTQISYHSKLRLTKKSEKKHKELESAVIRTADCVLATSYADAGNYRAAGAKRTEVITNGFEASDFEIPKKIQYERFRICYSGNLEAARNPNSVWKALNEISDRDPEFAERLQIDFYGQISREVEESLSACGLSSRLVRHGYVSHSRAVEGVVNSELLLLTNFPDPKSKGIIPGKLFEYLASRNPILALGPADGDVKAILDSTGAGSYFEHGDTGGIRRYIERIYSKFRKGEPFVCLGEIDKYSRKETAVRLSELIRNL